MKLSELKSGMRVKHGNHPERHSEYGIVFVDLGKIIYQEGTWNYLSMFTDDLKHTKVWDITEVYSGSPFKPIDFKHVEDLLWKRNGTSPEQLQLEGVLKQIDEAISVIIKLQEEATKLNEIIWAKK